MRTISYPMKVKPNRRVSAFTLIELLVVLSIIGLLAGLVVPSVTSVLATQKIDMCRENLQRTAEAIETRIGAIAKSPDFALALLEPNFRPNEAGTFNPNYICAVANYFPYHPDLVSGLLRLTILETGVTAPPSGVPWPDCAPGSIPVNFGGPYIGSSQNTAGSTGASKGVVYSTDALTDPWGRAFYFVLEDPALGDPKMLWRAHRLYSAGPNNDEPKELSIRLHCYSSLAAEAQRRLAVINKAILEYNKVNLPTLSLPNEWWDRNYSDSDIDTAYDVLVKEGFLERPIATDGTPVDFYAIDPWGYVFLTDKEASGSSGLACCSGSLPPFSSDLSGPVLRVVCGNIAIPGRYNGKNALPDAP